MENLERTSDMEFESKIMSDFGHLPLYHPEMGNESGFNYQRVEIKSHSFPVRNPGYLAGENIIFEPGIRTGDKA